VTTPAVAVRRFEALALAGAPQRRKRVTDVSFEQDRQGSGWFGWIAFASIMMVISGMLNLFYGVIAAVNDEWVVFGNRANLYLDISTWGWVHIVLGALVVVAGLALYSGNVLARTVGVVMAAGSIGTNFFWLPAYPIWSIIVITMNVLVIWALTVHGRDAVA
jgi:hypothetical protein